MLSAIRDSRNHRADVWNPLNDNDINTDDVDADDDEYDNGDGDNVVRFLETIEIVFDAT